MLEQICCVVSVSDTKRQSSLLSCSGVFLNNHSGFVLCSGAMFSNFLIDKDCMNSSAKILSANNFNKEMQVSIHHMYWTREQSKTSRHLASYQPAELFMLVNCIEFQMAFQKLFLEADKWSFYIGDEEAEPQIDPRFLSWFAVLKLSTCTQGQLIPWVRSTTLMKGHSVLVCGSPFGSFCPDLFMNTLSKGVVSNAAGHENALILTDARCLPGTEGGGVFVSNGDVLYLVGLIVSPLCWKSNEWIGLTLVCSFHLILKNILQAVTSHQSLSTILADSLKNNPQVKADAQQIRDNGLFPTVVLVESGQQWGSGIMLNPRLLLTCRHVVNGKTVLKVTFNSGQRLCSVNGEVLYSSNASSPYDIAVVQLLKPADVVVPQLTKCFYPGEDVFVLGYGALGKSCGPSLTSGILSKVISLKNKPVMLQTTCAVQCGTSGGAVIRTKTGEFLGIVSSNTRDFKAKVTYPHLNFSIPVSVLEPLLHSFAETGDSSVFLTLDQAEEDVSRVWRLQVSQSKL